MTVSDERTRALNVSSGTSTPTTGGERGITLASHLTLGSALSLVVQAAVQINLPHEHQWRFQSSASMSTNITEREIKNVI